MSSLAGGFVQILFGPHLRSTDNRPAGARQNAPDGALPYR